MSKFLKAASYAVAFTTMGVAALAAVPGFATGDPVAESKLTSNIINVDQSLLQEDAQKAEMARVQNPSANDGEIIFRSGTGDFKQPMPEPDPVIEESEELPVVARKASSLKALVGMQNTKGGLDRQTECLAGAVYFESKSESLDGQLAVARVVLERAKSRRFPNSVCGVVYQKKQFSFIRGGKMPRINKGHRQWRNAVAISKIAQAGAWDSKMEGALFFHAKYVNPRWRLRRVGTVGNHIFYR